MMMRQAKSRWSLVLALCFSLAMGVVYAQQPAAQSAPIAQPETASGYTPKAGWTYRKFAVAAANPLATEAGYTILRQGGNALDAAIAVQMVLGLVEPQASGIGGGAFLLYYDKAANQVSAFDGRETAPQAIDEKLFLKADGKPMTLAEAIVGGRSVGVPGAVRMLEMVHAKHGKLPWVTLFAPAIRLAEHGFPVSPRLYAQLVVEPHLKDNDKDAAAYFYGPDGKPWPVGHLLKNPAYAKVLQGIARDGSKALLSGSVAQAIVDKVRNHPTNPGQMQLSDLQNYRAKERAAFCTDYSARGKDYRICGMPPPSSGAITVAQIMGILAQTPAQTMPLVDAPANGHESLQSPREPVQGEAPGAQRPRHTVLVGAGASTAQQSHGTAQQGFPNLRLPSADWLHYYAEASRLAYADRARYIADPDFVAPPGGSWQSLVQPSYLRQRAALIGDKDNDKAMPSVSPGNPGSTPQALAPMPPQVEHGTSHISVIDKSGNAIAMTTTVEAGFGSRLMVKGFLLNNQLTDFSLAPTDANGTPIANRPQPGKRPRSSMSPTLVFDKATGQLLMTAGSPGGGLIIHYAAKTLYGVLNWGLSPQAAINLPNFGSTGGPFALEKGYFPPATLEQLKARGHDVREQDMTSGLQAIERQGDKLLGGADPRREGVVLGE